MVALPKFGMERRGLWVARSEMGEEGDHDLLVRQTGRTTATAIGIIAMAAMAAIAALAPSAAAAVPVPAPAVAAAGHSYCQLR